MNKIDVLVISNKFDFTTDLVCIELKKRNIKYVRINRDSFSDYKIQMNVNSGELFIKVNNRQYLISDELESVYYRAPTYFRETFIKHFSTEDQLYNSQWMAFIRNLIVFERAKWMNNPIHTYKAENKLLQLKYAKEVGFNIPETLVTNDNLFNTKFKEYAVKSLDTAIFTIEDEECFLYTNNLEVDEIKGYDLTLAPLIFQNNLEPKIDYRITVAGKDIYCAEIVDKNEGVKGDWRKRKNSLKFLNTDLSPSIKKKCFTLLQKLSLNFGGIDLVKYDNNFYFLEINPTGEWTWLVKSANQNIHKSIVDFLI